MSHIDDGREKREPKCVCGHDVIQHFNFEEQNIVQCQVVDCDCRFYRSQSQPEAEKPFIAEVRYPRWGSNGSTTDSEAEKPKCDLSIVKKDDGYWLVIKAGKRDARILLETRSPMVDSIIQEAALAPSPNRELVEACEKLMKVYDDDTGLWEHRWSSRFADIRAALAAYRSKENTRDTMGPIASSLAAYRGSQSEGK